MTHLLRRWFAAPDLMISVERVNRELRHQARHDLAGDVRYRERVKRRMREGLTSREMPPLFDMWGGEMR
jgi:hypothetical protein